MIERDELTRRVLRRAGMSEQSELTPAESSKLPEARAALTKNPLVTRDTIYRIIRPKRDDED